MEDLLVNQRLTNESGDDPPRGKQKASFINYLEKSNLTEADRTKELRVKGFEGRRLGPVQMTTDTAVRVTRMVAEGKSMP